MSLQSIDIEKSCNLRNPMKLSICIYGKQIATTTTNIALKWNGRVFFPRCTTYSVCGDICCAVSECMITLFNNAFIFFLRKLKKFGYGFGRRMLPCESNVFEDYMNLVTNIHLKIIVAYFGSFWFF